MNKKIFLKFSSLALISSPIIALVSCNTNLAIKHSLNMPIKHKTFLVGQTIPSNFKEKFDFTKEADDLTINDVSTNEVYSVNVVNSVDAILSSEVVAVNKENFDIISKIKFINNYTQIESIYSPLMKVSFDKNGWEFSNGLITKFPKNESTVMTISIGNVSKNIKLINRDPIINKNLFDFTNQDSFVATPVSTPQTPSSDFSVAKVQEMLVGKNVNVLKYEWNDNNPSTPRINLVTGFYDADISKQVKIDSTTPYMGLLVYLPKQSSSEQIWFRSSFNVSENKDSSNLGIDFNGQKTNLEEGWNLLQVNVSGHFTSSDNFLSSIRPILLSANNNSGSMYVAGIYQSDEEMNKDDLIKLL